MADVDRDPAGAAEEENHDHLEVDPPEIVLSTWQRRDLA